MTSDTAVRDRSAVDWALLIARVVFGVIFMAHGAQDPVVPYPLGDESRQLLVAAGYAVEWHSYPMAHSLCEPEVRDLRQWIAAHLR